MLSSYVDKVYYLAIFNFHFSILSELSSGLVVALVLIVGLAYWPTSVASSLVGESELAT
jgi:hypothetical protein